MDRLLRRPRRVCGSWLKLLLLLLLQLLSAPAPGRASPRLLDHPTPICWQQGLHCRVKNSTCLDDSWIHPRNLTPWSPKHIEIQLRLARTQQGDLVPVVHMEWTLQTDVHPLSPTGAKLSILQLSTNERLCVEFEFLSKLKSQEQWRLAFSHFVVEPGQEYEVTIHHLPKPILDGDPNHLSKKLFVPDCEDSRMKITTPCVSSGSLWDPKITVETLDAHQLRVSFTLWKESSHYQILLNSFPQSEDHSCFEYIRHIPAPKQEEFHQRAYLTLPLPGSTWCCRHRVQVQPFLSSCLSDCLRHTKTVPCPEVSETLAINADTTFLERYGFILVIPFLLLCAVFLMVCWKRVVLCTRDKTPTMPEALESVECLHNPPPTLRERGFRVRPARRLKWPSISWQKKVISEVGLMTLIGNQKQEVVGNSKRLHPV